MTNYGHARDPEWIQSAITAFEEIAVCVTELLSNSLLLGSIPQGKHSPATEVAASAILTNLMIVFNNDIDFIRDEIWPTYTAKTYTLYDLALTESRKHHNES